MSSLTEQERLGLDEVFLSISKHHRIGLVERLKRSAGYAASQWVHLRRYRLDMVRTPTKFPLLRFLQMKTHKKKKSLS